MSRNHEVDRLALAIASAATKMYDTKEQVEVAKIMHGWKSDEYYAARAAAADADDAYWEARAAWNAARLDIGRGNP